MYYSALSMTLLCLFIYGSEDNNSQPQSSDKKMVKGISRVRRIEDADCNRHNAWIRTPLGQQMIYNARLKQALIDEEMKWRNLPAYIIDVTTKVIFKVGSHSSCNTEKLVHPLHRAEYFYNTPHNYYYPYEYSDGGLWNSKFSGYSHWSQELPYNEDNRFRKVAISIDFGVQAYGLGACKLEDGIFERDWNGDAKAIFAEYGIEAPKKCTLSLLERVVMGFIYERIWQSGSILNQSSCADEFLTAIKSEFTSKQCDNDDGKRSARNAELIQRYVYPIMPRGREMRLGEVMRKRVLDGDNDPYASVELTELSITVKRPDLTQEPIM